MKRMLVSMMALALASGCGGPMARGAMTPGSEHAGHEGKETADHDHDDDDEPLPTDAATMAKAKSVRVLQDQTLECPSEVLGPVDVHKKMESTPEALDKLKLRAAMLGADAVTNVEFEHGEGGNEPTHLSGLAVRCKDLIRGRSFDVIGNITVHEPMGNEEAAFRDLKQRALEMHADLIVSVRFIHGEAGEGEGLIMTGTAIRVRKAQ